MMFQLTIPRMERFLTQVGERICSCERNGLVYCWTSILSIKSDNTKVPVIGEGNSYEGALTSLFNQATLGIIVNHAGRKFQWKGKWDHVV